MLLDAAQKMPLLYLHFFMEPMAMIHLPPLSVFLIQAKPIGANFASLMQKIILSVWIQVLRSEKYWMYTGPWVRN